MLWGILNSVISARYISRKVSGNCFVLLEQRLSNELTWFSWRFVRCHPSAASPAICTHLSILLPAPVSHSLELRFSRKCWLAWKISVSWGKKLGILRLWHCIKGISGVPWWFHYNVKRNTIIISLLCEHQALTCLCESYKCTSFACCWATVLYVSTESSQYEFCITYCLSMKPFFTVQWHHTSDIILLVDCPMTSLLLVLVSISVPPSLPPPLRLAPSIRPPIWLRWGVVGRGEWSGARDGATAGAQSDKKRQITPLTRAIHHLFISPFFHRSLPPHLYVKYGTPG